MSATYGAGGSLVAPALAARLDLPFFDRLLHGPDTRTVARVLERLSDEERNQGPPGRVATVLGHVSSGLGLPVPDADDLNPRARIRREVEANITRIARETGGVILGRSAAVVLGKEGCRVPRPAGRSQGPPMRPGRLARGRGPGRGPGAPEGDRPGLAAVHGRDLRA